MYLNSDILTIFLIVFASLACVFLVISIPKQTQLKRDMSDCVGEDYFAFMFRTLFVMDTVFVVSCGVCLGTDHRLRVGIFCSCLILSLISFLQDIYYVRTGNIEDNYYKRMFLEASVLVNFMFAIASGVAIQTSVFSLNVMIVFISTLIISAIWSIVCTIFAICKQDKEEKLPLEFAAKTLLKISIFMSLCYEIALTTEWNIKKTLAALVLSATMWFFAIIHIYKADITSSDTIDDYYKEYVYGIFFVVNINFIIPCVVLFIIKYL